MGSRISAHRGLAFAVLAAVHALESPMAFSPGGNVAAKACSFGGHGRADAEYACTAMLMPDGTDVTES
ncbi:hypothetical protein ACIBK9_08605 [Nonomuraea sp. NPDC050227]|uniref:hypothetical protein n=1 Tax=Nonomuraea sp. NPDC050227 TaxID=3364360 RepID=UPI0037AC567E